MTEPVAVPRMLDDALKDAIRKAYTTLQANTPGFSTRRSQSQMIGVVSRALLGKLATPRGFAASRSARLAVPLLAGMVLFVAPQPWFELRDQGAYSEGFLHFWLNDYFEFGGSRGTPLPTWNHLWFVVYLWAYSLVLAGLAALPAAARARTASASICTTPTRRWPAHWRVPVWATATEPAVIWASAWTAASSRESVSSSMRVCRGDGLLLDEMTHETRKSSQFMRCTLETGLKSAFSRR